MTVLNANNSYNFSNATIQVTDNTIATTGVTESGVFVAPEFSMLIPIHQGPGDTNTLNLFRPGELAAYISKYGEPDANQYGIQADFVYKVLSDTASNVSVYTANLRGMTATHANIAICFNYKEDEEAVHYEMEFYDSETETNVTKPAYLIYDETVGDTVMTDEITEEPVMIKQLHVFYSTESIPDIKDWKTMQKGLAALAGDSSKEGYKKLPWFGIMYRGASDFGNNTHVTFNSTISDYDSNCYYGVTLNNGLESLTTSNTMSLDPMAGKTVDADYYIENLFNGTFPTMRWFTTLSHSTTIEDLIDKYAYSMSDYIAGNTDTPTYNKGNFDVFKTSTFGFVIEEGGELTGEHRLSMGYDGEEPADFLFEQFFNCNIQGLDDINSIISYKFDYIPDTGFNNDTKKAIIQFIENRYRTTSASIMVGGTDIVVGDTENPKQYLMGYDADGEAYYSDPYVETNYEVGSGTFVSAYTERNLTYSDNMPNIRLVTSNQGAMIRNENTRKYLFMPSMYFDTISMCASFARRSGVFYAPFAGYNCRWTGFDAETMTFPAEDVTLLDNLNKSRINFIMRDNQSGGYLADQQTNTVLTSDMSSLNNAFLIGNMIYDCVHLAHQSHFTFNEEIEVTKFRSLVATCINEKYAPWAASMNVSVYREAVVGANKSVNVIAISINLKDIAKFTNINVVLNDIV